MDPKSVDPRLAEKLRGPQLQATQQPDDVAGALRNASKQFQLWEVAREVASGTVTKTPLSIPRAAREFEAARTPAPRRPEMTEALVRFEPASAAATRAWRGFRALLRSALTKPYRGRDAATPPPG
jgi:hypothetical protein